MSTDEPNFSEGVLLFGEYLYEKQFGKANRVVFSNDVSTD